MEWVVGSVQHYAWGDREYIPRLLECEPDGSPWAEWWIGTHPGAPSRVASGGSLLDHCGELPYLLKILAAEQPLSLQTHPSRAQAEAGFDREDAAGIALDAPNRTYRDRFPKPELLCALTRFDALCGFRPVQATLDLLDELGALTLSAALRADGLAATVDALYRGRLDPAPIIDACSSSEAPEALLVAQLAEQYPHDPSVVVTLLLNRVTLRAGEALYLGPGNLHAYLRGAGIEIMSASDNVVRGGLTAKHVDVDELLAVLTIEPLDDPQTFAREVRPDCWRYDTPGTPFRLWRYEVAGAFTHTATGRELVLCADGATDVLERGDTVVLLPGEELSLHGIATLFRVEEMPSDR